MKKYTINSLYFSEKLMYGKFWILHDFVHDYQWADEKFNVLAASWKVTMSRGAGRSVPLLCGFSKKLAWPIALVKITWKVLTYQWVLSSSGLMYYESYDNIITSRSFTKGIIYSISTMSVQDMCSFKYSLRAIYIAF